MSAVPIRFEGNLYKHNVFKVQWTIGSFCNYHCTYCHPSLNTGPMSTFVPLDIAKKVIDNIIAQRPDKNIVFNLLGGEPTVHPNFLELADYMHERNCKLSLITNGSRSQSFYRELAFRTSSVTFTYHAESVKNIDRFVANVSIFPKESVMIFIPMNPAYWDKCIAMFERLFANGYQVFPKVFLQDFSSPNSRPADLSAEQNRVFTELSLRVAERLKSGARAINEDSVVYPLRRIRRKSKPTGKHNGRLIEVSYSDGNKRLLTTHQLIHEGLYELKGVQCFAGVENISISQTGVVYKATCHEDGPIGNIYENPAFKLFDTPVTCTRARCWCTNDLRITKQVTDETYALRAVGAKRTIPINPA